MKVFNRFDRKDIRQHLRNDATAPERILWEKLKGRQFHNLKFRRQHGIGQYIVDFYCPDLKVAIEIDGDSHYGIEEEAKDAERSENIASNGVHILRFTNREVCENLEGVLEVLERKIMPVSPANPL